MASRQNENNTNRSKKQRYVVEHEHLKRSVDNPGKEYDRALSDAYERPDFSTYGSNQNDLSAAKKEKK